MKRAGVGPLVEMMTKLAEEEKEGGGEGKG